jgi:hypothetical protein
MKRLSVVVSLLGLMGAAVLPAGAQQKTVKLFGTTYNVESQSRAQTYKNGLKVTLPSDGNKKANLFFVEGADPSQDRLFVAAPIQATADLVGDQLYLLTGADANGNFTPASANLTQFFGGAVDYTKGGRPVSVMWLSDANTGVKTDRNIAVFNFSDADAFRMYDFDTMNAYDTDAVFELSQPEETGEDPGMPNGDFEVMAPGPNGTIVMAGRAAADADGNRTDIEIGVIDPKQSKFFNVKTDLMQVTQDSTVKIDPQDPNTEPNALIRVSDKEYWMIVSGDQQGDDDATDTQFLYRIELTFPDDLSKGTPGSIKAKVLARESLLGTPMQASPGAVFGMAVGREVAPGLRRLYFADWQGNLYTATPVP